MGEHNSIWGQMKSFLGIHAIRQSFGTSVKSALGATLVFVFLRALFTPIRMKVVTSLLEPDVYGAVTLLSMTAHGLALVVSLGGFETLLRRLPSAKAEDKERVYGAVLTSSSVCGVIAILVMMLLWRQIEVFREMAFYVSPWAAGLLAWMFLHIQQRMYWFLGNQRHWMARITQLFWSDLWFIALLLLIPFGVLQAEGIVLTWAGWLVIISLLTWKSVPFLRSFKALVGQGIPKEIWLAGLPLLPVILGEWIFRLSGHYVLLTHVGATEMAFYALSLNVALVGLIAATPLVDICIVALSHLAVLPESGGGHALTAEARRVVSHGLRHLCAVLMPAALVMIFMPEDIIQLLAADRFLPAARFVPLAAIMPILLALNLMFARLLMSLQDRTTVIMGAIGSACLAVMLCLILVPKYEVYGALWGIILACAVVDLLFAIKIKIWRWVDPKEIGVVSIFMSATILGLSFWGIAVLPIVGIVRLLLAGLLAAVIVPVFRLLRPSDFLH